MRRNSFTRTASTFFVPQCLLVEEFQVLQAFEVIQISIVATIRLHLVLMLDHKAYVARLRLPQLPFCDRHV